MLKKIFVKLFNIFASIVGMKFILRKYVVSSKTVRENGKKITVLMLNSKYLLNDGILDFHLRGGFSSTFANTIIVLDTVLTVDKNDFEFCLNHEVGHIVLGHVTKLIKSGGSSTCFEDIDQEREADNYARQQGYHTPDFRKLFTLIYGELASVEFISANDVPEHVEKSLEEMASRM